MGHSEDADEVDYLDELRESSRMLVTALMDSVSPSQHDMLLQALLVTVRSMVIARRDIGRAAVPKG